MELVEIAGHTIDKSILNDGVIIDIGCRGFAFSTATEFAGRKIYAVDCDSEVFENQVPAGIIALNYGISDGAGEATYYRNGEATCLQPIWESHKDKYAVCKTITMEQLYEITGENVDVLKLDCEGAEYIILGEIFKPIPKQISIEFHYHCLPELHNRCIDGILDRLKKDYDAVNLVWEQKHGAGFNFWDVLFVRKW